MESRVREKMKMNEMIELIETQHDKLEQILTIITKEIKTTPGLFIKINSKMAKLDESQSSQPKQNDEQKFKQMFMKFLTISDKLPNECK